MKMIRKKMACLATISLMASLGAGCVPSTAASLKNATLFVAANATDPMNVLIKKFEQLHQNVSVTHVSTTHLVNIVPKKNPAGLHSLHDLGSKHVKLVLGAETVPVGKYSKQVFVSASKEYGADFSQKTMANVVSFETDVKQVLQKVAMGEADAGVVYRTDITLRVRTFLSNLGMRLSLGKSMIEMERGKWKWLGPSCI